jgi:hypothetical protein
MRNNNFDFGLALSGISIVLFLKAMFHLSWFAVINLGPILECFVIASCRFVTKFPWNDLKYNLRLFLRR